jgi:hypothetical protein
LADVNSFLDMPRLNRASTGNLTNGRLVDYVS